MNSMIRSRIAVSAISSLIVLSLSLPISVAATELPQSIPPNLPIGLQGSGVHHSCSTPSKGLTDIGWEDSLESAVISKEWESGGSGSGTIMYTKDNLAVGGNFEAESANGAIAIAFEAEGNEWTYTFLGFNIGITSKGFENHCTYTLLTPTTGLMETADISAQGDLPAELGKVSSSGSLGIGQ